MAILTESDYKDAQLGDAKVKQEFLDEIEFDRVKAVSLNYLPSDLVAIDYSSNSSANIKMYTLTHLSRFSPVKILWERVNIYPVAFK